MWLPRKVFINSILSMGKFTSIIESGTHAGVATGKDCVIVDDLVQTGGTLIECAKVRYQLLGINLV